MNAVAGRSFYTPFWAGIENNWYRNLAIDAVWKGATLQSSNSCGD